MSTRVGSAGAGGGDLREEMLGRLRPPQPQVTARQRERDLRVIGCRRESLLELQYGLLGLAVRDERLREELPQPSVGRGLSDEAGQGRHRLRRLPQLHQREHERLEGEAVLHGGGGGGEERVVGLARPTVDAGDGPHQEPARHERVAIAALRALHLALLQLGLGRRDRLQDRRQRVGRAGRRGGDRRGRGNRDRERRDGDAHPRDSDMGRPVKSNEPCRCCPLHLDVFVGQRKRRSRR